MESGTRGLQVYGNAARRLSLSLNKVDRQAAVAQHLRVSRQRVAVGMVQRQIPLALERAATRAGRKLRLEKERLALLEKELLRGATAHGYATDLWSLTRVAKLISGVTGVSYHPVHLSRILRQMGWNLQ